MGNPSTKVATFNGTPDGFTVTGLERYNSGLWLEEGTTNGISNPSFEASVTGWVESQGTTTYTQSTDHATDGSKSCYVQTSAGGTDKGLYNSGGGVAAVSGDKVALQADVYSAISQTVRFLVSERTSGGTLVVDTPGANKVLSVGMNHISDVITLAGGGTVAIARLKIQKPAAGASEWWMDAVQLEAKPYATSYVAGTRAASSASLTMAEPVSVACWYREAYSGAKQFAYLDTLGQLGDYGDVSWAAGDLTISTSRNLVIGPFAAFDRALTAGEQANLRSTQNWTMNSVNGSNIILPLSGARRRRR